MHAGRNILIVQRKTVLGYVYSILKVLCLAVLHDSNIFFIKDGSCRKFESGNGPNRYQIPGVFISCCEHGHIYGFHMMVDPEGRKDLFHMLYERFPQSALDQLTVVCVNVFLPAEQTLFNL
jgi:hypothetical protein